MACYKKCNGIECLIHVLKTLSACSCNCNSEEGCISLNQGIHQVTVDTKVTPVEVFLSVRPLGTPVCVGAVDMVGYTLLPTGFTLYADIKSNSAEVCYFVETDCCGAK
jgi:hypothetical protein